MTILYLVLASAVMHCSLALHGGGVLNHLSRSSGVGKTKSLSSEDSSSSPQGESLLQSLRNIDDTVAKSLSSRTLKVQKLRPTAIDTDGDSFDVDESSPLVTIAAKLIQHIALELKTHLTFLFFHAWLLLASSFFGHPQDMASIRKRALHNFLASEWNPKPIPHIQAARKPRGTPSRATRQKTQMSPRTRNVKEMLGFDGSVPPIKKQDDRNELEESLSMFELSASRQSSPLGMLISDLDDRG